MHVHQHIQLYMYTHVHIHVYCIVIMLYQRASMHYASAFYILGRHVGNAHVPEYVLSVLCLALHRVNTIQMYHGYIIPSSCTYSTS